MSILKKLKLAKKIRIMLFQGSPRNEDNCPDQNSKTSLLAQYIIDNAPMNVEIDYCDLSIQPDRSIIQPCKGCVSTGGGYHCHYACDCYVPRSDIYPDLMHDANIYGRLEQADGFMVLTPVHWYSVTSQVKAMFDRLVCCNLTLTTEQANELGIGKDAEKSRALEKFGEYNQLLVNHYEGKYAAFLIHGDAGGKDYAEFLNNPDGKFHPKLPDSYTRYSSDADPANSGWVDNPKNSIMGLVWQCRYSGIHVPNDLIEGFNATTELDYSEAMDAAVYNLDKFYEHGLALFLRLVNYLLKSK